MLSISLIRSIEHASQYYNQDNYYAKDEIQGFSEWIGGAAKDLGFAGDKVTQDDFLKILKGKNKNGEDIIGFKKIQDKISYESHFNLKTNLKNWLDNSKLEESLKRSISSELSFFCESFDKITKDKFEKHEKKIFKIINSSNQISIDQKISTKKDISKIISIYKKPAHRRPAFDLTFSAPKSVSILGLVHGEEQIIAAHREAVRYALSIVETEYSQVRITDTQKNERRTELSKNIIAATFEHDVSRKTDPQLHTHCVLMNLTKIIEEWRSLNPDGFFFNSKKIGLVYQNKLASLIKNLGYDIKLSQNGTFEIVGYTDEQLKQFSKRSDQLRELGAKNQKEATKIIKINRDKKSSKEEHDIEFLKQKWIKEGQEVDLIKPISKNRIGINIHKEESLNKIIFDSMNQLTQNKVSFIKDDLEREVLSKTVGTYEYQKIKETIDKILEDKTVLIQSGKYCEHIQKRSFEIEDEYIAIMQRGKDVFNSIVSLEKSNEIIDHLHQKSVLAGFDGLNRGQREAMHVFLTSNDRIFAWQGVAGAGKTFTLEAVARIAKEQGYVVKGFAPSAEAAKNLSKEAKLEVNAMTLESLLIQNMEAGVAEGKEIWVVDEAGLMSAHDAHRLFKMAERANARVLMVGDTKQLSSVGAGNPFKQLQEHGIQIAELDQSMRQKKALKEIKLSVELIAQGKHREGLDVLEKSGKIFEKSQDEIISSMAVDYLSLSKEKRDESLFIVSTNYEKSEVTNMIRSELKKQNQIQNTFKIKSIVSRNIDENLLKYSNCYQKDDFIVLNKRFKNLKTNSFYKINSVDNYKNKIIVSNGDELISIDVGKIKCNLYYENELEIGLNDKLKWTKNHKSEDGHLKRLNGQYLVVTEINQKDQTLTVKYDDGKKETVHFNKAQFLDYSYVTTVFSSQGKTCENVYASLNKIDRENFYVTVSRSKKDCKIYTEDKNLLYKNIEKSGSNKTAHELINYSNKIEKEVKTKKINDFSSSDQENFKINRKIKEKTFEICYKLKFDPSLKNFSEFFNSDYNNFDFIKKEFDFEINKFLNVKNNSDRKKIEFYKLNSLYEKEIGNISKIVQARLSKSYLDNKSIFVNDINKLNDNELKMEKLNLKKPRLR